MEQIINPWFFYWIHVAGCIRFVAIIMLLISIFLTVICSAIMIQCFVEEEKPKQRDVNLTRISFASLIVSALIVTFIPTTEMLTKMIVVDNVTHDNIDSVVDLSEKK